MPRIFLEISISASEKQREMLLPTMIELGCEGFQETDNELLCYIDRTRWTKEHDARLKTALKGILRTISVNAAIAFREIADTNWNADWEKTIQPIPVGNRFIVTPSWHHPPNPENRIILTIDPKMSFGTGYHETTRLVIRLLEQHLRSGFRVLDVGTGTGILAIAAMKLGAGSATGIDNDEWSITNALENIALNGVERAVRISADTPETFTSGSFDMITANITLNTNIGMLPEFHRLLKPGGIAILSGLLNTDRELMLKETDHMGFGLLECIAENEWIAFAVLKPM